MKNRFFPAVSCCFLLFFAISHSAVNYPYPQKKSYGNSTINVGDLDAASATLKSKFTSFLGSFYTTGTCPGNKSCARIKFDTESQTVSEGIGYGMLMMVYFSDASTSYQTNFDLLWAYYQSFLNERGLMRWKINGFSTKIEDNAASDADFDVAVALVMAHYQFGTSNNKNYLDTARVLISKIRSYEISPNNLHKPGDVWNDIRNPSYVSPAAWAIFKEIEPCQQNKNKWQSVIEANYTMLKANQNASSAGLFSDWCTDNGSPATGPDNKNPAYDYDAARVPWRVAWANAWYGHEDAKTLLQNINSKFLNNKNATDIKGPISLTGSTGNDYNSTFVGPFTNALSYSSSNQTKMNSFWSALTGLNDDSYYKKTSHIMAALLATGNMPNLRALKGDTNPAGECSTSGDQIDQFVDADGEDKSYARTWEPWYAFTDKESKGSSTIQNTKTPKDVWDKETKACKNEDTYNVVMQDGSDWVAKIANYNLSQGDNEWHPFVALGLDAENNGTKYNFSGCTGGFSYKYKGASHNFRVQLKTVTDYDYHFIEVGTKGSSTNGWEDIAVQTTDITQEGWGKPIDFKLGDIEAFAWEIKGDGVCKKGPPDCKLGDPITGIAQKTGSLAIKDFKCVGTMTFPEYYPPKCGSGSGGSSSSSARSSSSVGGSSSSSARSSSSGGGSSSSSARSSSSDGNTPVILSQTVLSNGLSAMQNAVNLRATGNATVQIFDLKGNAVRTFDFSQGSYVVHMANLPRGLYLVRASSGSWRQTIAVPVR
ncbi:MAG: hypothetical protein LBQ76_04900 [Candidatus Fibromonas sp.]|nr:hypothetical protein [Candidatus Fibromonas sp.]